MVNVIVASTTFICEWDDGKAVTYGVYRTDEGQHVTIGRDDESEFVFDADTWPVVRDKIDEAFGLSEKYSGGCNENSR